MSLPLIVLAVLTFGLMVAGLALFIRSISTKDPFRIPKFLLVVPVLVLVMGVLSEREKAATPAAAPATAQGTGEVVSFITPPGEESSEPFVTPSPTPAQDLAISTGRDLNDPEVADRLARLNVVCPETETELVTIMTQVQDDIRLRAGKTVDIITLMDAMLSTATSMRKDSVAPKCSDLATLQVEISAE